MNALHLFDPT
jgi:hypothetical protein